jgi:hypothetical protein
MIFSIADTTPPAAKFQRIRIIAEKIRECGSVTSDIVQEIEK